MTKPGFFVVSAPKAGTTSPYHCLKQHPQLFMTERKQPKYADTLEGCRSIERRLGPLARTGVTGHPLGLGPARLIRPVVEIAAVAEQP